MGFENVYYYIAKGAIGNLSSKTPTTHTAISPTPTSSKPCHRNHSSVPPKSRNTVCISSWTEFHAFLVRESLEIPRNRPLATLFAKEFLHKPPDRAYVITSVDEEQFLPTLAWVKHASYLRPLNSRKTQLGINEWLRNNTIPSSDTQKSEPQEVWRYHWQGL